jgi:UPF0755 protein
VSRRSFRSALIVVLASFVLLGACGTWLYYEISRYPRQPKKGRGSDVTVEITRGMKFPEVARELERTGVIERPRWFRFYAMHRGLANQVQAGTYVLRDDMSPRDVLDKLVKGVPDEQVSVTIPEGKNLLEVFAIIAQAGVADAAELEALARDPNWLKEHGIEGETVEGYLFPETYSFKKSSSADAVLEKMVRLHRSVYDELRKKHGKKVDKLKKQLTWGDRELVVLASIVEKEAVDPAERSTIASVFYNRLTLSSFKTRRLETDPTIRYGCTVPLHKSEACKKWDPAGRLHRAQLDDADNPYNTYQHPLLPPGPIANPGRASLEAVMAPADTSYLYFVAKDQRTHVFSKTYAEHSKWVDKYMR